jgi:hypothetical protein
MCARQSIAAHHRGANRSNARNDAADVRIDG